MIPRFEIIIYRFEIRSRDHNAMFYSRSIILLEISCDSRDSRQDSKDSRFQGDSWRCRRDSESCRTPRPPTRLSSIILVLQVKRSEPVKPASYRTVRICWLSKTVTSGRSEYYCILSVRSRET